jgi:hypothetical protein
MNKTQFIVAVTAAAILPFASIAALSRTIVNPTERMVTVPGLEFLGESRISSVRHCVTQTGVHDWRNLITDSDLENMEICLRDLT